MFIDYDGPEDGPPLILLHGGMGTGRFHWSKQVKGLVADGWRVHMPDLPGHGRSPAADGPVSRELLVDAVRAHVRSLDGPAFIAGFSMGGHTAMGLAETDPQLLAALVVIGVSVEDHPGLRRWRDKFDPDVLEANSSLWARQISKLHEPLGGPDAWREVYRRYAGGLQVAVDLEALADLAVPTLLIRGDSDETVDPSHYGRLREIWPHAEEFVIPAGGHDVQLTRAHIVEPGLRDFLGRAREDRREA